MQKGKVVVLLCAVAGLSLMSLLATSVAQEAAEARVGNDESGRLPPGYSAVVKKSQRREIYSIQEKYESQIDELNAQIRALEEQREAEIQEVLSDEQKTALALILKFRAEEKAEQERAEAEGAAAEATGAAGN